MSMFTSWFNQNLQNIHNSPKQADLDTIVNEVLKAVRSRLSQQIGQQVSEQSMNQIKGEVSNARRLQEQLIDTKAQYHELVQKLTLYQQNTKKIGISFTSFVNTINKELQSQQLPIPLKEIQKAIADTAADRVEKHMNFLIRIYTSSFDDMIKKKMKAKQAQFIDQIQLLKNLNKNLQSQLISLRSTKSHLQKKNIEFSLKLTELSDRNVVLQQNINDVAIQNDLKEKYKAKENEFIDQIKLLEKQKNKLQQKLNEAQSQIVKSGTIVEKIRFKDEEMMEEMKQEIKRKENVYQQSLKKAQGEKMHLQEQIQTLKEELENQKLEQTSLLQQKSRRETEVLNSGRTAQLEKKISQLEGSKKQLQSTIEKQIGKQIVRDLFLRYDDESKEWSIRKDIRRQLYGIIGVQQKQSNQENQGNKKWFGLF